MALQLSKLLSQGGGSGGGGFGGNLYIPDVGSQMTLIDARDPETNPSGNINDLWSNISWSRGNTVTNTSQDGVACWNMDNGYLETGTRTQLARNYTLFYLWKPRNSDSGWRTVHRGDNDHWGIIQDGNTNLGMYSNRCSGFRDSGYDITRNQWQTWIVNGHSRGNTDCSGPSVHYVNGRIVGVSDRVGSGTNTYRLGWPGQGPGKIAVAGVINNNVLQSGDIQNLHDSLAYRYNGILQNENNMYYYEGNDCRAGMSNWNYSSEFVNMTELSGFGNTYVHGWGGSGRTYQLTLNSLPAHTQVRFSCKIHMVDSWDNEYNNVRVNNSNGSERELCNWRHTYNRNYVDNLNVYNGAGVYQVFPNGPYSYRPWANGSQGGDGYLEIDSRWYSHTNSQFRAWFRTDLNQSRTDEAYYIHDVRLDIQ